MGGYGLDMEWIWIGYGLDMDWIWIGYGLGWIWIGYGLDWISILSLEYFSLFKMAPLKLIGSSEYVNEVSTSTNTTSPSSIFELTSTDTLAFELSTPTNLVEMLSSTVSMTQSTLVADHEVLESTTVSTETVATSTFFSKVSDNVSHAFESLLESTTESFEPSTAEFAVKNGTAIELNIARNISDHFDVGTETVFSNLTRGNASILDFSDKLPISESIEESLLNETSTMSNPISQEAIDQISTAIMEALNQREGGASTQMDNTINPSSQDPISRSELLRIVHNIFEEVQDSVYPAEVQDQNAFSYALQQGATVVGLTAFGCYTAHKTAELVYKYVFRQVYWASLSGKFHDCSNYLSRY